MLIMVKIAVLSCAGVPAAAKPARKRGAKKAAAPDGQPSSSETSCDDVAVTGSQTVKKVVKSRRKFKNELTTRLVAAARAALAAPETGQLPWPTAASFPPACDCAMQTVQSYISGHDELGTCRAGLCRVVYCGHLCLHVHVCTHTAYVQCIQLYVSMFSHCAMPTGNSDAITYKVMGCCQQRWCLCIRPETVHPQCHIGKSR